MPPFVKHPHEQPSVCTGRALLATLMHVSPNQAQPSCAGGFTAVIREKRLPISPGVPFCPQRCPGSHPSVHDRCRESIPGNSCALGVRHAKGEFKPLCWLKSPRRDWCQWHPQQLCSCSSSLLWAYQSREGSRETALPTQQRFPPGTESP